MYGFLANKSDSDFDSVKLKFIWFKTGARLRSKLYQADVLAVAAANERIKKEMELKETIHIHIVLNYCLSSEKVLKACVDTQTVNVDTPVHHGPRGYVPSNPAICRPANADV